MKSIRSALALILATAAFAVAPAVRADEAPFSRDARARFAEGVQRYAAHDYDGARAAFLQAYAIAPAVDVLYNLALSELRSDRPLDALVHLRAYRSDPRPTPDERAHAERFLAEAERRTGHLALPPPLPGATLAIDGAKRIWPESGDIIDVRAGIHVVSATTTDGELRSTRVEAQPGQRTVVALQAARVADGPTPLLEERADRDRAHGSEGNIGAKPFVTTGLAAAAVVATGFGVAFLVDRGHQLDRANSLHQANLGLVCPSTMSDECDRLAGYHATYDADKTRAIVMFSAAGALGLGALATWGFWPRSEDGEPRIRASAGLGHVSATLIF